LSRWCPSCRREWDGGQVTCTTCLVDLVDDLSETVRCKHCEREWPTWMQSCPHCLAELHHDPARAAEGMAQLLGSGMHLPRPDGLSPFESSADCTLMRVAPRSGLIFIGTEGFLEATVKSRDRAARPPMSCRDIDGTVLFGMTRYDAAAHALVAVAPDGAPIATYLRVGAPSNPAIDVRDETSAPVARLVPIGGTKDFDLVETGGGVLGVCSSVDDESDSWVDDQWSLHHTTDRLPLRRLGAVGLVLAAKVLFGRANPERRGPDATAMDYGYPEVE
jgi:hypothetical protein